MRQKIKSKKSFNNESDGNTEYFNLQIKLPNGKIQTIKVYENDDPNEIVEEFCKIHTIDNNIKYKLVANIKNCQKQFLMKAIQSKVLYSENSQLKYNFLIFLYCLHFQ